MMYLSKLQDVFLQIANYACPNCQIYFDTYWWYFTSWCCSYPWPSCIRHSQTSKVMLINTTIIKIQAKARLAMHMDNLVENGERKMENSLSQSLNGCRPWTNIFGASEQSVFVVPVQQVPVFVCPGHLYLCAQDICICCLEEGWPTLIQRPATLSCFHTFSPIAVLCLFLNLQLYSVFSI